MRPVERLGSVFAPTYKAKVINHEFFEVTITPPRSMKLSPVSLKLTNAEFLRFQDWRAGKLMIQDAFPDWTASQRELLQTGLSGADFPK